VHRCGRAESFLLTHDFSEPGETDTAILEGVISIEAALTGGKRTVSSIVATRHRLPRGFSRVRDLAEARDVPIKFADREEIDRLSEGGSHGGVIAMAGDRTFDPLESVLAPAPTPFLVMIDGVEDPFNFGQSIRSTYAAGATGLLLRARNWLSAAGTVARASAGASELIPAALVESPQEAHEKCSEAAIETVLLADDGEESLFEHDLTKPLLLVLGGEQRGVTRSFKSLPHTTLKIPYGRTYDHSLGTAASAAVVSFEVMRQRQLSHRE